MTKNAKTHTYISVSNLIKHLYKHKAIFPYAFLWLSKMCKQNIIVRIILAGVSIVMLSGNSDILTKAGDAISTSLVITGTELVALNFH